MCIKSFGNEDSRMYITVIFPALTLVLLRTLVLMLVVFVVAMLMVLVAMAAAMTFFVTASMPLLVLGRRIFLAGKLDTAAVFKLLKLQLAKRCAYL